MLGLQRATSAAISDSETTYRPTFDERKATHLAAYLLQKTHNQTLYILKLVKLLYIVDRESLIQLGHPVTYDNFVSMPHGPVPSNTLDLINGMVLDKSGIWNAMISDKSDHMVSIVDCEVSYDSLSEAEMEIADQVFDKYGRMPRFDLVEITHTFSEWQDPHGSSKAFDYKDILKAGGLPEAQITAIIEELAEQDAINKILTSV